MRKIIACILFLTILLTVSGCGKKIEQPEYLTLTPKNIEQYVRISVNTSDQVSNERVEGNCRLGNSKVQVTIVPIDSTKTVIDSVSISVYIDRYAWSVDGSSKKELTPLLDGFMTSFNLKAESALVGTTLSAPEADDVIVTITSVDGKHYYK